MQSFDDVGTKQFSPDISAPPPEQPVVDDFSDDEVYDESPEQMIKDIGDHPLMERVQEALYQQLVQNHERVTLELREKEEDLRRVSQKREDIGVELYGVQQQLAKLQMALETTHTNFNSLANLRAKAEVCYCSSSLGRVAVILPFNLFVGEAPSISRSIQTSKK